MMMELILLKRRRVFMNKWISVKDSLPENDTNVLVFNPTATNYGCDVFMASFENKKFRAISGGYWEDGISHWQPLPKSPEQE